MVTFFRLVGIIVTLSLAKISAAIIPIIPNDLELAESPVIVIGYWPKTAFEHRAKEEHGVVTNSEALTDLQVIKVIHGEVRTGRNRLILRYGIDWQKDGKGLQSGTSTEVMGDVQDVSVPNIWFLKRVRSFRNSDKTEYLHIYSFKGIQNQKLLPFYEVLRSKDRNQKIASMLADRDSLVVERALNFVSGFRPPWPYWPDNSKEDHGYDMMEMFFSKDKQRPRLLERKSALSNVIDKGPSSHNRGFAAALYAEMFGTPTTSKMRTLLQSTNEEVKLVAACYLARFGDASSAKAVENAVKGSKADDSLICELIYATEKSKRREYVPTLINFLETRNSKYYGSETSTPSLFARRTLFKLTNYTFPQDVAASRKAWSAALVANPAAPERSLGQLLGSWKEPLGITCRPIRLKNGRIKTVKPRSKYDSGGDLYAVTLVNRTDHPITIQRNPSYLEFSSKNGMSERAIQSKPGDYLTLGSGQKTTMEYAIESGFGPGDTIKLSYFDNGKKFGKNAWTGTVSGKVEK